jgi:two-component system, sensor histidine kinase and response regulator
MKTFSPAQQSSASALSEKINARVLVAEDGPTSQKVISRRLEKLGCTVQVAQDGYQAVQAATRNTFDVIFMDHQMPVMDGFEATARIRKNSRRHIPIIALTANAMEGEQEQCLEAGMDDYLSKPVRSEELIKTLRFWTEKRPDFGVSAVRKKNSLREKRMKHAADVQGALDQFIAAMAEEGIERDEVEILFESFLETSQVLMQEIEQAAKDRDSRQLAVGSHTLKGSFANFGLEELAGLARELETAGNTRCWEGVEETLELLCSVYSEAREILVGMVGVAAD